MLSLPAAPPPSPDQMKLYRGFLGLTQAQLAAELCTTTTSVSRWESEITPISQSTLAHLYKLVTAKLQTEISRLFSELVPKLSISQYTGLVGHPRAEFTKDHAGKLYLGSVFIDPGYRKHVLYLRAEDGRWYGLDRDEKATLVDEQFLRNLVAS